MYYGIDSNGNKVFIDAAHQKSDYRCQICGNLLIQRKGNDKRHHFAHTPGTSCLDNWSYEYSKSRDISDWHLQWQERFPAECREVVVSSNNEKHRADVLLEKSKKVIEFQKSPLSPEEFERRNKFFNSLGYKVMWIFDEVTEYDEANIVKTQSEKEIYHWIRPRKTFNHYSVNSDVELYLQLFTPDDNVDPIIYKVTWVAPSGFEYFALEADGLSIQDFLELFTFPLKSSSGIPLETICDKMMPLYSEGMMTVYSGCPISKEHISADNHIESEFHGIRGCSNCQYCVNYQPVLCKGRIAQLNLPNDVIVLNVSRNQKGLIDSIIIKDSISADNAKKYPLPHSNSTWKSITEQWPQNCNAAIFVNVQTGWFLKIIGSQYRTFLKKQPLQGYFSKSRYEYNGEPKIVFDADKPLWKLVWWGDSRH